MMRLRTLAVMAAFVWITTAQAHTMVWFETPNDGLWGPGGSPGNVLNLYYPEAMPGVFSWQVSMKAAMDDVIAWSLDLRTAPNNGIAVVNPQIAPNPFSFVSSPGTSGSGTSLLYAAHGFAVDPLPPQTVTLLTFTLRKTTPHGEFFVEGIFGGPSASLDWGGWFNSNGDYEIVQFGANPPAQAEIGYVPPLQLITLIPYPEPSSLTLLVLGAAVCMRRRRSCMAGAVSSRIISARQEAPG